MNPTHDREQSIGQRAGIEQTRRFLADVHHVVLAGQRACRSIEDALVALERGVQASLDDTGFPDVIDTVIGAGGREVRLQAAKAFEDFERAIGVMRARIITVLVDVYGLTLTEAGRRLGVSRQAAARLYAQAPEDDHGSS